ncbi:HipA domain-containing protein [Paenibacillus hubeiensis]|uniref:HipA domain-containing protein n=1 Tax=Paenibacillus hubeiensis TaxID=3077330 RepID=UPI0031BA7651
MDFSNWQETGEAVTGVTKKLWLTDGSQKGLFKFGEEWTEVIAKDIAQLLGIPCMDCEYGTYHGAKGVMCYDLGGIVEFGDTMTVMTNALFDTTYSIDSIEQRINSGFILGNARFDIIKMFIFDYVIGNRDRHFGNFAIHTSTGELSPLYDNAASLCYGISAARAKAFLTDLNSLHNYAFDLMSQARIPVERAKLLELVYYLKDRYPLVWENVIPVFLSLQMSDVEKVVNRFKGIVDDDILRCIIYCVGWRLEMLKMV